MLEIYKGNNEIAVSDGSESYSYAQLCVLVNKMISYIEDNRINRIAMRVEQGLYNYCLEWAAYLSGITFCCYDIDAPIERIRYCNDEFCPDVVISDTPIDGIATIGFGELLSHKQSVNNTFDRNYNEVAYVLFTSGSTGLPKGVMVKRCALENVVTWAKNHYFIDNTSIYAQYSKNSFDLSVLDIFLGLSSGARLIPFKGINKLLPGKLIRQHNITFWHSVPSAFIALQNRHELTEDTLSSMKTIVFCGETLYPQLVKEIFASKPDIALWNTYGPTEATIYCSAIKLENIDYNDVSIGCPIDKMIFSLYEPCDGEGELIIAGENIAKGYINQPENASFFEMDYNGNKVTAYHSGDIVKQENELYYFICRKDNQVKIAGNRFDLDEITKILNEIGYYSVASILLNNLIYTFIQKPIGNKIVDISQIEKELHNRLPKYGIPSKIILLDVLPLNPNGKVDKAKLKNIINNGDIK